MPILQVPAQLTVEHLMAAVKQLSPAELREFGRQFSKWQQQNGEQAELARRRGEPVDVVIEEIGWESGKDEAKKRPTRGAAAGA